MFADEAAAQERVRSIQASVSHVRRLPAKHDVRVVVEDPATVRERVEEQIAEELDAQTRHAIERTWTALKLVDAGFDVAETFAAVYEDAVGGYFDVEEGRLVLVRRKVDGQAGRFGRMLEDMVIAHELVHGLQDQHFDLWSLSQRELENGDAAAAVQALVEGDASFAMLYRLPMGLNPDMLDLDALKTMMRQAGGPSTDPGGELGKAPAIVKEPLLFAYVEGLAFVATIKKRGNGWDAVDAAYRAPPLSTEQILHPDRYGPDGDWPTHFPAGAGRWLRGYDELQQDSFGELGVRLVVQQHVETVNAWEVADGWDGDRLWTLDDGARTVLVWRTTWDTESDATAFARAAGALTMVLHPTAVPRPAGRDFRARGEREHRVRQRGMDVAVVLGAPVRRSGRLARKALRVDGVELRSLDQLAPVPERPRPPTPTSDGG